MIAGDLTQGIWNKCYLFGFHLQYKVNKFLFFWISFNVEFSCDHSLNIANVVVANMSFIRSWMNRDTLCSEHLCKFRSLYEVGIVATSTIAQCSKLVDVDA